jgi:hypothetical protein
MERVDNATGQPVCFSLTPLDCRMDAVRTKESAAGDLIADILLYSYGDALRDRERQGELSEKRPEGMREVDMTLICGGSLRGDDVFGPGGECNQIGRRMEEAESLLLFQPSPCGIFSPFCLLKMPLLSLS